MPKFKSLSVIILLVFTAQSVNAQRGGFGQGETRGGDRGGNRGSGGGTTGDRGGFGGRGGGGDTGRGGGFASRLDTNGDGRIDQAEVEKISDGFKNMMESRGIRIQPGTVDEVSNNMRQQFEQSRATSGGTTGEQRRNPDGSSGNRGAYSPSMAFRPREKARMTIDLPEQYSAIDIDQDGQIGLNEWMTNRRQELSLFDEMDTNADGILTPMELSIFDSVSEAVATKDYKRERLTIIRSTSTARTSNRPTTNTPAGGRSRDSGQTSRTRGGTPQGGSDRGGFGTRGGGGDRGGAGGGAGGRGPAGGTERGGDRGGAGGRGPVGGGDRGGAGGRGPGGRGGPSAQQGGRGGR